MKRSKRYLAVAKLIDNTKIYAIDRALELAKQTSSLKFDATVEAAFRLNLDPRHADQMLRGSIILPAGTGKMQRVLVITTTKQKEAMESQADFVGGKEMIEKIQKGWFNFDVIIATPEMMGELGKIGRILGPKGLMPTAKLGTVTINVQKAIADIRKGKVEYRVDKQGNIHVILGKVSFTQENLKDNFLTILNTLRKVKPAAVKSAYIKNISITTAMGPGIKVLIEE